MTHSASDCPTRSLESFLAGQASSEETLAIEEHLTSCAICQSRVQENAANVEAWKEVGGILRENPPPVSADVSVALQGIIEQVQTPNCLVSSQQDLQEREQAAIQYLQLWLDQTKGVMNSRKQLLGTLSQYEITDVIGQGGMGLVLKAFDPSLNRIVAIKTLPQILVEDETARRARTNFLREAQLAAALRHSNLIEVYAVDSWKGTPYLVMPYLRSTLQNTVSARRLNLRDILLICKRVAEALAAIHEKGMVHRDVKPSNVLMDDSFDSLVLSDFGLARDLNLAGQTLSGLLIGTPEFMSPEQAEGRKLDVRSDIFSLGSLMYWLATGRSPFQAESTYGIIRKLCEEPHVPVRFYRDDLPKWFGRLLDQLLVKNPENRKVTARQLASQIDQCLEHCERPSQVQLPRFLPNPKFGTTLVGAVGVCVTAFVLMFLTWIMLQPPGNESTAAGPDQEEATVQSSPEPRLASSENSQTDQGLDEEYSVMRQGPLDALDEINLAADIAQKDRLEYWMQRIVALPRSQISAESFRRIEELRFEDSPSLERMRQAIITKDPFEVIQDVDARSPYDHLDPFDADLPFDSDSGQKPDGSSSADENPFEEVDFD